MEPTEKELRQTRIKWIAWFITIGIFFWAVIELSRGNGWPTGVAFLATLIVLCMPDHYDVGPW
jgi:hypothetical protein